MGGALDDVAIFSFVNDFRRSIGGGGERRKAAGERFEDNVGKGVVEGREDEEVGCLIGFLNFPGGSFEVDMFGDAEPFCYFPVWAGVVRADHAE